MENKFVPLLFLFLTIIASFLNILALMRLIPLFITLPLLFTAIFFTIFSLTYRKTYRRGY